MAPQFVEAAPVRNIVWFVVLKIELPKPDWVVKLFSALLTPRIVPSVCIDGGAALANAAKPITIAVAQNTLRIKTSHKKVSLRPGF